MELTTKEKETACPELRDWFFLENQSLYMKENENKGQDKKNKNTFFSISTENMKKLEKLREVQFALLL